MGRLSEVDIDADEANSVSDESQCSYRADDTESDDADIHDEDSSDDPSTPTHATYYGNTCDIPIPNSSNDDEVCAGAERIEIEYVEEEDD